MMISPSGRGWPGRIFKTIVTVGHSGTISSLSSRALQLNLKAAGGGRKALARPSGIGEGDGLCPGRLPPVG